MADNTAFIRAYIENANDDSVGGFTIPLPVTRETLRPWLEAIGAGGFDEKAITIREIRASPSPLEEVLEDYLQHGAPIAFDELNYLPCGKNPGHETVAGGYARCGNVRRHSL